MKRCIITLSIFCVLFSSFTLLVSAHPGRTDSNGGHFDHSSGEYHYHTGEYAGRNNSSQSNKTSDEQNRRTVTVLKMFGNLDGSVQAANDLMYSVGYNMGFHDAVKKFEGTHPFFRLFCSDVNGLLFSAEPAFGDKRYKTVREKHFFSHDSDISSYYWSDECEASYNQAYDQGYKSVNVTEASNYESAIDAKSEGYEDGYKYFSNEYIKEFEKEHPILSTFAFIHLGSVWVVSIAIFIFLIYLLTKLLKNKNQRKQQKDLESTFVSDNSAETSSEKSANPDSHATSEHKSLIPEFVSSSKSSDYLIVGEDIPCNNTYFSPINENEKSFIRICTQSNSAEYEFPILYKKQYITLMKGEKIKLINCRFELEE